MKVIGKIFVLMLMVTFIGCTVNETPDFIGIKNIKVLESTKTYVTIKGDALFNNPNDVGGKLKVDRIKVLINGNEMASVSSHSFEVPVKKEFTIPLKVNIPYDSIFSNNNIGGIIGSLFAKKIEVRYLGEIDYEVFGFSYSYNVDEIENMKIKL